MTTKQPVAEKEEWVVIDKQKVIDRYEKPGVFTNGFVTYKYEYIIKNIKTGELRRV